MQFQIRIDDNNHLTIQFSLATAVPGGAEHGPEVASAIITDTELSDITTDDFFDLLGQVVDYFTVDQSPPDKQVADWRAEFLAATRTQKK